MVPALAGHLINAVRDLTVIIDALPAVNASPDPNDDFLLAIAVAGSADFLVTGDKRDLLALHLYEGTRIITARNFLAMHNRLPRS